MKPLLVLSGIAALSGCSLLPASHSPGAAGAQSALTSSTGREQHSAATLARAPERRRVGDLVVHRFSGSFHRTPLVLTEEVVGKEGERWVVDLTLEEGATITRFRVRMDDEGAVSSASKWVGQREVPGSLADYNAMVESTVFAADANDGLVGAEKTTCLLGSRELDCQIKSYRVRVADKAATLKVSESAELPGRDLAGEIVSDDGRVLYRSQIVAVEHQKPGGALSLSAER